MDWANGDALGAGGGAAAAVCPQRAAVVPRARAVEGGAALPLHERLLGLVAARRRGPVNLYGPPGSGKSTALAHLAAVLPGDAPVILLDSGTPELAAAVGRKCLAVYATRGRQAPRNQIALEMAPWGEDDWVEYLAATRRGRCSSVMERLRACDDRGMLGGLPELWRVVLDAMAEDTGLPDVASALRVYLASKLVDPNTRDSVMMFCVRMLQAGAERDPAALPRIPRKLLPRLAPGSVSAVTRGALVSQVEMGKARLPDGVARLIWHRPVQVALAAQWVLWALRRGAGLHLLSDRLPRDLVREVAALAALAGQTAGPTLAQKHGPTAPTPIERLKELTAAADPRGHPLAISILHAAGVGWRPEGKRLPFLGGADLTKAKWEGVDLSHAVLVDSDLSDSDLGRASLDYCMADRTLFRGVRLVRASLARLAAREADFTGADLSHARAAGADLREAILRNALLDRADLSAARLDGADLIGASLRGAVLVHAKFGKGAMLGRADLADADLTGAAFEQTDFGGVQLAGCCFREATLIACDLEEITLDEADFTGAALTKSYLTGSRLRSASFRGADLRETGLAEVDWEGADLRRADLRGASFHAGSTRCGLVGSTVPCEGSRTGFYTDDYNDQDFKRPEEIRKANLRGADLRGAKIKGVDFYLVDLRGARYTPKQERHLRCTGAILD
jgi:uncharacterized protein YjbI with pentapeptide repeats/energy-coupling factor transporter ATP-binding protein EcfA2